MRAEALLKRETNAQESGNNVAAIHRLLPPAVQLTAKFIRTTRNGMFFECDGWPPLPLQLKTASSKYCSGKYVPRNTPSEYRIRHPRD